ncbi:uncharacterized protein PFL1_05457 [Pseudozyma flocculosa PF-1]|uniref:Phytanoyl-CoA dioxygenase n=1 Tax=Pseudozyma flocculosa PF-1 TaxID=1277687 RepID=A0A061H285_9BASI|nr:uncharacterized protein PFL1_05457 [Pseudozyma flocculosa PF-1]EPQ26822.1 hypothetical protein PFL1_05457 [Pseudozyma flocculosa PF-1]
MFSTPYPLSDTTVADYQAKGHVLLRSLFTPEEVERIRKDTLDTHNRLLPAPVEGPLSTYDKAFSLTENLWQHSEVLRDVVLSKRVANVAAKLLGCRDVRVYHDLTFFKDPVGPTGGFTPFHQDGHYWPLDNPRCLTLWLPLTDCPAEMGTMSFVDGSHEMRDASHLEITDESDALIRQLIDTNELSVSQPADLEVGDATFHSCWTMHAAGSNRSDRRREVFAVAYFDADAVVPVHPPTNKRREANLHRWFPDVEPGKLAASHLNPAVLAASAAA